MDSKVFTGVALAYYNDIQDTLEREKKKVELGMRMLIYFT